MRRGREVMMIVVFRIDWQSLSHDSRSHLNRITVLQSKARELLLKYEVWIMKID